MIVMGMANTGCTDNFRKEFTKCKSKKDYKKLCKKALKRLDASEVISGYMWQIMSDMIGEENYIQAMTIALQAYIAHTKGIEVEFPKLAPTDWDKFPVDVDFE